MRGCARCGEPRAPGDQSYCTSCRRDYNADWRERKGRRDRRHERYNITRGELDDMEFNQRGRCASCHQPARLQIDHCHQTGRVRGLLCGPCNGALGMVNDNPVLLRAAALYIERQTWG